MKYHLWTIGCQMNEADSRHLGAQLEAIGYQPSSAAEDADLVVLNTCVVRQQAEDKAASRLGALRAVKEARPDMVLALMGCMVGLREAPALKRRFPFVDVFLPPSETAPLLDHLERTGRYDRDRLAETRERAVRDAIQDGEHILPALQRGSAVTAHVPVVLGCSHACTFCVIPYRRGAERSRPRREILDECRALAGQGIREVMLLGQIVDRYGMDRDGEGDLADLLRAVAGIEGLERVRFLTSHPNYMTDRILEAVAEEPRLCPQIEVPVQAGHDEVLARMRRGYTVGDYRRLVGRIRRILPGAAIHTDIIVGFPGETEAQFESTVDLVREIRWDKIHLAKYSERPKTLAARQMPDDVPADEKERRRKEIEAVQAGILAERHAAWTGRTVEVLAEDKARGRWRGRTPEGKLVFFEDPADRRGQVVRVRIRSAEAYKMMGEPEPGPGPNGREIPELVAAASAGG